MKNYLIKTLILSLPIWFIISCQREKIDHATEVVSTEKIAILSKSELDSIATFSQKTLLKNISGAISKGGTEYAVEFCNLKAMPLTDSLSAHYGVSISRITDKSRNPLNQLKSAADREVFEYFRANSGLIDSLISNGDQQVYYKRINAAMPACIQCHGNPESDIASGTLLKIQTLYNQDQALGYALNDFRGLWKIETN
ncbi:MAG: DUF3365 domain-containing protein [Weeksellaceae bacterium]